MSRPLLAVGLGLGAPAIHATVDRIEGQIAVLEFSIDHFAELPLALLPPGLREGEALMLRRSATRTRIRRCRREGAAPQSHASTPAHIRAPRRNDATQPGETR